jgi:hypothetical protein
MMERLTTEGVEEVKALQIAWASFPFDDSHREPDKAAAKAVRDESRDFLKRSKGIGSYEAAHREAVESLRRMQRIAEKGYGRYYALLCRQVLERRVPDE